MSDELRRSAQLEKRGPAGAFVLTDAERDAIGGGSKAFPVTVTIGDTTLRLRLASMKGENQAGEHQGRSGGQDDREVAGLSVG